MTKFQSLYCGRGSIPDPFRVSRQAPWPLAIDDLIRLIASAIIGVIGVTLFFRGNKRGARRPSGQCSLFFIRKRVPYRELALIGVSYLPHSDIEYSLFRENLPNDSADIHTGFFSFHQKINSNNG
jgi:hypothetical protein